MLTVTDGRDTEIQGRTKVTLGHKTGQYVHTKYCT